MLRWRIQDSKNYSQNRCRGWRLKISNCNKHSKAINIKILIWIWKRFIANKGREENSKFKCAQIEINLDLITSIEINLEIVSYTYSTCCWGEARENNNQNQIIIRMIKCRVDRMNNFHKIMWTFFIVIVQHLSTKQIKGFLLCCDSMMQQVRRSIRAKEGRKIAI